MLISLGEVSWELAKCERTLNGPIMRNARVLVWHGLDINLAQVWTRLVKTGHVFVFQQLSAIHLLKGRLVRRSSSRTLRCGYGMMTLKCFPPHYLLPPLLRGMVISMSKLLFIINNNKAVCEAQILHSYVCSFFKSWRQPQVTVTLETAMGFLKSRPPDILKPQGDGPIKFTFSDIP